MSWLWQVIRLTMFQVRKVPRIQILFHHVHHSLTIISILFPHQGVPGIGPKIAADLINEFGSLDNLLNNIDKVPQQKRREKLYANIDQARLSRDLVELNRNVPHHSMIGFPDDVFSVRTIRIEPIDPDRLFQFYDEMGFKELKRTLQEKLQGRKFKRPAAANRRPKGTIPKPEDYANVPF